MFLFRKILAGRRWLCLAIGLAAAGQACAQPSLPTDRLIVKFRDAAGVQAQGSATAQARIATLASRVGMPLSVVRVMGGGAEVLRLPKALALPDAQALAKQIAADPNVQYAEPDRIMHAALAPNDSDYNVQYSLHNAVGGIDAPDAWDITTGSSGLTVAVIDTGILFGHPDLQGRTVPGYNFVSNVAMANNGVGRSADASDPGDWVSQSDIDNDPTDFSGCTVEDSSWHGTHVAGIIGAAGNNDLGVAGLNWASPLLPVRVLGKCGGYESDIVDGMRWAAGLPVAGVPANPHPARVLNLSLGGDGACDNTYQSAINDVNNQDGIIVVAAGNETDNVANYSPASCTGIITVGAIDRNGGLTDYSNFGAGITLMAPGGTWSDSILSTGNDGTTSPGNMDYIYMYGTSMATPHVAGVISLMLAANPALTNSQIVSMLKSTAFPFPTGTGNDCDTSKCGAGILNAAGAVSAAAGNSVTPPAPWPSPAPSPWTEPSPQPHYPEYSGGGGGCAISPDGKLDPLLPGLLIAALIGTCLRWRYRRP